MISNFIGGGIEAKWVIAGLVAAGVAVGGKDKSTSEAYQQQQQLQAAAQQNQPCPATCP
jgi:hypothetical protein